VKFNVLVIIWVAINIPVAVWLFRARPPVPVWRQYPFATRLRAVIPGRGWRTQVRPEHLAQFERYRVRAYVQWAVTVGGFSLLYLYLHLMHLMHP